MKENKLLIIFSVLLLLVVLGFFVIDYFNLTGAAVLRLNGNSDWLGFLGSIIGSFITLWGIVFTIQSENKGNEDQTRLSIAPFYNYNFSRQGVKRGIAPSVDELKEKVFTFSLQNNTKEKFFLIVDVDIKNIGVGNSILKYIEREYKREKAEVLNPRVIESGSNDQFTIYIEVYKSDLKNFMKGEELPTLNFHFCDVLGNHYVDQIETKFDIITNRKCTVIKDDSIPHDFDFEEMYLRGNRKEYLPRYQHDSLFEIGETQE